MSRVTWQAHTSGTRACDAVSAACSLRHARTTCCHCAPPKSPPAAQARVNPPRQPAASFVVRLLHTPHPKTPPCSPCSVSQPWTNPHDAVSSKPCGRPAAQTTGDNTRANTHVRWRNLQACTRSLYTCRQRLHIRSAAGCRSNNLLRGAAASLQVPTIDPRLCARTDRQHKHMPCMH